VAAAELQSSLAAFVTFARSLKGDEKSEAQLFLDHFFRALGHGGVQEAGATLEFRIAKKPGSAQLELIKGESAVKARGGKKFADLLWPERVLIEMKSRKENLEKYYDQAFEYWTHIVPKRRPQLPPPARAEAHLRQQPRRSHPQGRRHLCRRLPQDRRPQRGPHPRPALHPPDRRLRGRRRPRPLPYLFAFAGFRRGFGRGVVR
jgi:hypothetical protein